MDKYFWREKQTSLHKLGYSWFKQSILASLISSYLTKTSNISSVYYIFIVLSVKCSESSAMHCLNQEPRNLSMFVKVILELLIKHEWSQNNKVVSETYQEINLFRWRVASTCGSFSREIKKGKKIFDIKPGKVFFNWHPHEILNC